MNGSRITVPLAVKDNVQPIFLHWKKQIPLDLGICIIGPGGTVIKSGDWHVSFTLQSISKVISFIASCLGRGISYVLERVDVEPTGDPFNSIIRLKMHKPGKPFNPMINAGAITVASLLPGESPQNKVESLCTIIESIVGKRPTINEAVFPSEWQTAHRNRALAYYLKETGFLEVEVEVEDALEIYLKQCAIEVNAEDIAMIGLILAHDGYHPLRNEQIIPKEWCIWRYYGARTPKEPARSTFSKWMWYRYLWTGY